MKVRVKAYIILILCAGCAGPEVKPSIEGTSSQEKVGISDAATKERMTKLFDEGLRIMDDNPKGALALFNEILMVVPDRWEIYYNSGLSYLRLNEYEKAEERFKKALKNNAPPVKAYNAIGSVYLASGNMIKAVETIKKSLDIEESQTAMINIAGAYQALGQNDMAVKYYRKAGLADPSNRVIHNNLGVLLYNMGNYKGALEEFNKALDKKGDDDARLLMYEAQSVLKTGDYEGAVNTFKRMLAVVPDNPSPFLNMGIIYEIYLMDMEKAVENFEAYIKKGGPKAKEVEAWLEIARNKGKSKEGG
ncbi:MAG: tetratricopeptide repeat protein [Deltaproteobacteria bacterium]